MGLARKEENLQISLVQQQNKSLDSSCRSFLSKPLHSPPAPPFPAALQKATTDILCDSCQLFLNKNTRFARQEVHFLVASLATGFGLVTAENSPLRCPAAQPEARGSRGLRLREAHKHWVEGTMDWLKHTDTLLQCFHEQGYSRRGPTAPEGISAFSRATQIRNKQTQQAAETSEVLWFQRAVGQDLSFET